MKERKKYIDIAKFLLIIIMVFHHVTLYYPLSTHSEFYDSAASLYGSFFMIAFFIITGYCTSFDKNFRQFMTQGFKVLIIPSLFFSFTTKVANNNICDFFTLRYWLLFCSYWFLTALFICRTVTWFIDRTPKQFELLKYIPLFLISIYGVWLNPNYDESNWFCYKHAMIALPFVVLGNDMKSKDISENLLKISFYTFIILQVLRIVIDKPSPSFAWGVGMKYYHYPFFLLCSISGTGFILYISNLIKLPKVLQIIGRNTIVVYCINGLAIKSFYKLIYPYIIQYDCLMVYLVIVLLCSCLTMVVGYYLALLLNTKYLSWCIGKSPQKN